MDIKEIALKLQATDRFRLNVSELSAIEFAEALVTELAKQNKPVMVLFQHKDTGRTTSVEPQSASDFGRINKRWINCGPLFSIPPTAEQIANETAEAIATYLTSGRYMALNPGVLISTEIHTQYIKNHDIYQANAIRRGEWKEFKK